ncbi:hypothetical protein ABW636_00145 [Aquimarina sp. 2201CG1-2-11]|uniref:hypothetical protein n=1 Tax=Aquimarina discodermiae TaxID=3231043 RepID=UPI0034622E14
MVRKKLILKGAKELDKTSQALVKGGGYIAYGCANGKTGTARADHHPHKLCENDGGTAYYFGVRDSGGVPGNSGSDGAPG